VQGVRKLAGAGSVQDSGDLQQGFETLLGRVPKERALLALVAYSDIDDAVQFASQPSKPALSADDTLVAEAVDVLMVVCLRVAGRQGFLGSMDVVDPARIDAMARSMLKAVNSLSALEKSSRLVELMSQTLDAADDRRIRGLLGLSTPGGAGHRPNDARSVAATSDNAIRSDLPDRKWRGAMKSWWAARLMVDRQFRKLRSALRESDDEDLRKIAVYELADAVSRIDVPLRALLQRARRGDPTDPNSIRCAIAAFRSNLAGSDRIAGCDNNLLSVSVSIHTTLMAALSRLKDCLSAAHLVAE
jgi:hypothetical protein